VARVRCQGLDLELAPGETVLEGLQRGGLRVPSSCRVGACQTCVMQARSGSPGAAAQLGLRATQKEEGWFLACQCRPEEDLEIGERTAPTVAARIVEVHPLGMALVRVRLRTEETLSYRPGQFVHLERSDGLIRAYSLANLPGEDLELHVRVHPQGHMSRWLAMVSPGENVRLRGPSGECFYRPDRPEAPMLLVGTGTGLAPLWAILRDAFSQGHRGPITLVHGARDVAGLYYVTELQALSRTYTQLRYVRCVLEGEAEEGLEVGDMTTVVPRLAGKLTGTRVYLCGDPERVVALKKRCFLAGASMKDIYADPFVLATPPVSI